jgi:hypothetical protein
MSENAMTYGYEDDNQEIAPGLQFGLNAGAGYLTKFEFNPNGGKEGAVQDSLDIVFTINGKDISYRQFPIVKAFADGAEVTDPNHPKMKEAFRDFNSIITHILHIFVEKEAIKTAMQVPIKNFKHYCELAANVLPKDYAQIKLDIFAQWQWQITGDNEKTYLRLPKNMKQGKWACKAVEPVGEWKEKVNMGNTAKCLTYVDDEGNVHPFVRTKWFMESNFAKQQQEEATIKTDSFTGGDSTDTATEEPVEGTDDKWVE